MIDVPIGEFTAWVFTAGLFLGAFIGAGLGYALGRIK